MGSVEKIGDDYFIEFYARGLKYQQKVGSSEQAAHKALETIEAQLARGEAAIIVRDVDHDIFFQDFLKYARQIHSPATYKRFDSLVKNFQSFLREQYAAAARLSEITPRVIEQYKAHLIKTSKPRLVNFSLFLLRDVFEYAIKLGHLNDNPTRHVPLVKGAVGRTLTVLSEEELKQVFNAADSYLWFFIETILVSGAEPEELVGLKWPDVDWTEHCFKVNGKKERRVAMNARAIDILKQLQTKKYKSADCVFTDQRGIELTVTGLRQTLDRVAFQCNFKKDLRFSAFRHTFVRNLIKRGITASLLYKIMGWEDIGGVAIYSRFLGEYWEHDIYKV